MLVPAAVQVNLPVDVIPRYGLLLPGRDLFTAAWRTQLLGAGNRGQAWHIQEAG